MSKYYKHPRTPHLPHSGGATEDDRTWSEDDLSNSAIANSKEIVVSLKMDGENFNGYHDHCHARSIDSRHHPSRDWAKRRWNEVKHNLPVGWKVSAENTFALHTIEYSDLPSYLLVFAIWDENQNCLDFDQTKEWCDLLGLHHVPVLYRGPFDLDILHNLAEDLDPNTQEGYVVRTAQGFHYDDFDSHIAKYVSAEFKAKLDDSTEHWMYQEVVPNKLRED